MASDRHIDDAIDRAVRDIMRAEPRTGLRGRVLTEIERPSRRFQFRPAFAGAALLVVAAVLVAVLLRPVPPPALESIATRQDQPAPTPVAPTPPVDTRPAPPPAVSGSTVTTPRLRERDRVAFPPPGMVTAAGIPVEPAPAATLVSIPDSAVGTPDAKTPEPPIVVPRIEVVPISIPPIVISPIPRSR
jgi:hypothetical protein